MVVGGAGRVQPSFGVRLPVRLRQSGERLCPAGYRAVLNALFVDERARCACWIRECHGVADSQEEAGVDGRGG